MSSWIVGRRCTEESHLVVVWIIHGVHRDLRWIQRNLPLGERGRVETIRPQHTKRVQGAKDAAGATLHEWKRHVIWIHQLHSEDHPR